ncbi:MAG: hypothetical protein IEMM0003_0093 [bacterium]|nr:MAG: hypothetical protein IEMM0003_0093 [bacterium]
MLEKDSFSINLNPFCKVSRSFPFCVRAISAMLLKQIAEFISEGLTVKSAIDKIAKRSDSPQAFTFVLLRLEEKL